MSVCEEDRIAMMTEDMTANLKGLGGFKELPFHVCFAISSSLHADIQSAFQNVPAYRGLNNEAIYLDPYKHENQEVLRFYLRSYRH